MQPKTHLPWVPISQTALNDSTELPITRDKMEWISGLLILVFLIFWVWTGAWAYSDAKLRGRPPLLVSMLVLFVGWPISLAAWVALRPEKIRPPFNLDDYRVQ